MGFAQTAVEFFNKLLLTAGIFAYFKVDTYIPGFFSPTTGEVVVLRLLAF